MCVYACVCVCVHAWARMCARACVLVYARVHVCQKLTLQSGECCPWEHIAGAKFDVIACNLYFR